MRSFAAVIVLAMVAASPASAAEANPIEKIMEMISDLQAKVIGEGKDAQKEYDEYAEFCEDRSTNLGFEIKTGKANVAELKATIEEETATIGALETEQADSDTGAPAAAVYEGHSDGIIGTLEGLTEKAEAQLDKARKTESTALQNYQMLKQSLTDEIEFANKDMDKAKKGLAESQESKATASGDLEATSKDLADDVATKATLHQDCMNAAEEFELATKSRGEELTALATAKKVIAEATGGAAGQSYSFLQ